MRFDTKPTAVVGAEWASWTPITIELLLLLFGRPVVLNSSIMHGLVDLIMGIRINFLNSGLMQKNVCYIDLIHCRFAHQPMDPGLFRKLIIFSLKLGLVRVNPTPN